MRTIQDLQMKQALPLNVKISITRERIRQWVNEFGADGVYVSFSGGKDSTVLLRLVREMYPEVEAVFVDTGLEYPEIRDFVRTFENVTWLKPKMNFRAVIEKYGYPFISKEVAHSVRIASHFLKNPELYKDKKPIPIQNPDDEYRPYALIRLEGGLKAPNKDKRSMFNQTRWKFLIDAPFNISEKCCFVMKKEPLKDYHKETGKYPFTAQMACESRMRRTQWLKHGCNMFDAEKPMSNPMAFWTEQDVLEYIRTNNVKIAPVYGDVVYVGEDGMEYCNCFTEERKNIKTTGVDRTGCMFCGFGCHLEKTDKGRFESMKETHPKQYEWIMKPWDEGGLGYKEVIDWINEHGNLHIRY